ncbi:MAG: hypothetical protein V7647_3805 [Acidobacteriota bacterium]
MRRCLVAAACVSAALAGMLIVSCGGSPNGPGTVTPPPTTPPPNVPPVIDSIGVQGRGSKEPANFSDLGETVDVIATVHDAETPVEELQYTWTADVGAFDGTGAKVTWRAPDAATTPAAATLSLKVTEKYGYPGAAKIYQQDVTSSAVVSLHNSRKEVGDMARQFLLDFSDSNIRDIGSIMRNFIPGCYGTKDETDQVTENRRRYRILESQVGEPQTSVNFGGVCPYKARKGDACTAVPVYWNSTDLDNHGATGAVTGTDWVASFYMPDKQRWGLCDSSFDGRKALNMRAFIR